MAKLQKLYTWGKNTGSLGYSVPTQVTSVMNPTLVADLPASITQVSLGNNHSAVIDANGVLYTFGQGSKGQLGHNDNQSRVAPKEVEFFSKNNLKISQVHCGEQHTVALTTNGDVWTWGFGGRIQNFLLDLFFLKVGALGHGDMKCRYTPTPVQFLRNLPPTSQISSGQSFVNALNNQGQMYNWGKGDYGVFGDGYNKSLKSPRLNTYFEFLAKEQNLTIKKIKSSNNYSIALMSDGNLYGWGSNEAGQMGTKTEIGVEIYETANFPTPVVNEEFKDKKIVDFDVGEDVTAILLSNNQVYWSGMRLAYKPELLKLDYSNIGQITNLGCCFRSFAVVDSKGTIFMKNKFAAHEHENLETGIFTNSIQKLFNSDKVIEIGGNYRNRYAIVEASS